MRAQLEPESIIDFWFGPKPWMPRPRWWQLSEHFDQRIATDYGESIAAAIAGELDDWQSAPQSSLALILLLDQLTRNCFRGTARAFAGDLKARQICAKGLDRGDLARLHYLQVMFYCMPLQHSEVQSDQNQSVLRMSELQNAHKDDPTASHALRNCLEHAQQHQQLIARFGMGVF